MKHCFRHFLSRGQVSVSLFLQLNKRFGVIGLESTVELCWFKYVLWATIVHFIGVAVEDFVQVMAFW